MTHGRISRNIIIFEQAIHGFSKWMELFDLFICALLKLFKECINICTELPAASLMLESFEEVGGVFPEYFSSGKGVQKITKSKGHRKNSSKNFTAEVFF